MEKQWGVIPRAVGASYAVLVAEQLFVSGCDILISITSAGIINQPSINKQFVLITEAIRDEGTSYHYLPDNEPSQVSRELRDHLESDVERVDLPWVCLCNSKRQKGHLFCPPDQYHGTTGRGF